MENQKLTLSYLLAAMLQISFIEKERGESEKSTTAKEALENFPRYLSEEPQMALQILDEVEAFIFEKSVGLRQC